MHVCVLGTVGRRIRNTTGTRGRGKKGDKGKKPNSGAQGQSRSKIFHDTQIGLVATKVHGEPGSGGQRRCGLGCAGFSGPWPEDKHRAHHTALPRTQPCPALFTRCTGEYTEARGGKRATVREVGAGLSATSQEGTRAQETEMTLVTITGVHKSLPLRLPLCFRG